MRSIFANSHSYRGTKPTHEGREFIIMGVKKRYSRESMCSLRLEVRQHVLIMFSLSLSHPHEYCCTESVILDTRPNHRTYEMPQDSHHVTSLRLKQMRSCRCKLYLRSNTYGDMWFTPHTKIANAPRPQRGCHKIPVKHTKKTPRCTETATSVTTDTHNAIRAVAFIGEPCCREGTRSES